jgi:hypothetical protein
MKLFLLIVLLIVIAAMLGHFHFLPMPHNWARPNPHNF